MNNRANSTPDPDIQAALLAALEEARKSGPRSSRRRILHFLFSWNGILLSIFFIVFIVVGLFGLLFPSTTINLLLIILFGITILLFLVGRDLRIPMNQYRMEQANKKPILEVLVNHIFDQADYYPAKGIKKNNLDWLDLFGKDIDQILTEDLIDGKWKGQLFLSSEVFLYKDIFPVLRWADKSAAYIHGTAFLIPFRDERIPNFHISPVRLPISKLVAQQMAYSSIEQDYLLFFEDRWFSREMPLLNALRKFNTEQQTQLLIGKSDKGFYAFLPSSKDQLEFSLDFKRSESLPAWPEDVLDVLDPIEWTDRQALNGLIQELVVHRKVLDFLLSLPEIV